MYELLTRNSVVLPLFAISSKIWQQEFGMIPRRSGGSSFPSMVWDFPVPVWP